MKAVVYLATGFEETEAIVPIDLLRRAGIDVTISSIDDELVVKSSHGVAIKADKSLYSFPEVCRELSISHSAGV